MHICTRIHTQSSSFEKKKQQRLFPQISIRKKLREREVNKLKIIDGGWRGLGVGYGIDDGPWAGETAVDGGEGSEHARKQPAGGDGWDEYRVG